MILVDTTPLVALCDRRDAYHEQAVDHLRHLSGSTFGTCEAVLVETCFHLPHEAQRHRLRALLDELGVVPLPPEPNRGYRNEVFEWLVKYAEHEPDWADGCLAVLCGRDAAAKVWTYDSEFSTTWSRPDGTPFLPAV